MAALRRHTLGVSGHVAGWRRFVSKIGNGDGGSVFITDGNLISMVGSNYTGNRQRSGSVGSGIVNSVSTVIVEGCTFNGNTGARPRLFQHCLSWRYPYIHSHRKRCMHNMRISRSRFRGCNLASMRTGPSEEELERWAAIKGGLLPPAAVQLLQVRRQEGSKSSPA